MVRKRGKWNVVLSFAIFIAPTICAPTEKSLVISTTDNILNSIKENTLVEPHAVVLKITSMKVEANVTNRFLKAVVISKVKNLASTAQIATFAVIIPEQAYISGFVMEIDGKSYEAYVQEKSQAKDTFDKAVASGLSAGHVSVSARDSNKFTVSINVEPQSKATFYLKYEELLKRLNEKYEIVINIHPGQPVKNLAVEVRIDESRPLKYVKAANLRTGNEIPKEDDKLNPQVDLIRTNDTSAIVKFNPSVEKQKELADALGGKGGDGLAGQFVVLYDVERDPNGGEVLVDDSGYFVHFFAPAGRRALPKLVAFVLDTSGSMEGRRVAQLKDAMNGIVEELDAGDEFAVVEFASAVKVWDVAAVAVGYEVEENPWTPFADGGETRPENKTNQVMPPSFKATKENKINAVKVVNKLEAFGGTDIKSALKVGLEVIEKNKREGDKRQPIIIFLTDGEATVGETDNDKIISIITELNAGKCPIFSLSFGDGADRDLLQRLSLKNLGFSRHIYEASDASLQLQEFYKQISSPVLANVTFKYTQQVANATEVTRQDFPILFDGSEIVVSGVIDPSGFGAAPPAIVGWDADGPVELEPAPARPAPGGLERLWAYLTVRQQLELRDAAAGAPAAVANAEKLALDLALRYSFVTDVTSLVVVRPNDTAAIEVVDAVADPRYPIIASGDSFFPVMLSIDDEEESAAVGFSSSQYSYAQEEKDVPVNIEAKLPWLSGILKNGTIEVDSRWYKIGQYDNVQNSPNCSNVATNVTQTEGTCTLIRNCPRVYGLLTDFENFKKFFCDLSGYVGVCCPKESVTS